MSVAVEALPEFKSVVVRGEGERLGHRQVCKRPVAVDVVEIVGAILKKDTDRFSRRLPDEGRVVVSALAKRRAAKRRRISCLTPLLEKKLHITVRDLVGGGGE